MDHGSQARQQRGAGVLRGRHPGVPGALAAVVAARLAKPARRFALLAVLLLGTFAALTASAFANAPNPTAIVIEKDVVHGTETTVTVSGTWAWGEDVPSGGQKDCNDTRVGVGYAVDWGDNTTNPLEKQGSEPIVYVGDAKDDWVHSVTEGKDQVVDGPFKKSPETLVESMEGETPEKFGEQGISTGASTAVPTAKDAEHWFSNCGPTKQEKVDNQTIGNSDPTSPENGYPAGKWGPITHTYTTPGPYTICPVMYDPHSPEVGVHAGGSGQIIAGGTGHNNDNSVEKNGNQHVCEVTATLPSLTTSAEPSKGTTGGSLGDKATITGNAPEGSITWKLYGPFESSAEITESSCTGTAVFTSSPVPVTKNGSYTPSSTASVSEPGFYQWVASFESSNTSKNFSVGPVGCGEAVEQVKVTEPKFTIEKEQEIADSGLGFTKVKLSKRPRR